MGTNKSKKQKRFEKFVEKQVKKEQRAELLEKLSNSTWKSTLMKPTKELGRKSETKREKLHRAILEEKHNLARSDPTVRLYVAERNPDDVRSHADRTAFHIQRRDAEPPKQQQPPQPQQQNKKAHAVDDKPDIAQIEDDIREQKPGSVDNALKRARDDVVKVGGALAKPTITRRKRQKKGRVLEKLGFIEHESEGDSEEEGGEDDIEGEGGEDDEEDAGTEEAESEFDSSASEGESDSPDGEEGEDEEEGEDVDVEERMEEKIKEKMEKVEEKEKHYYTGSMLKPHLDAANTQSAEAGEKAYFVSVKRPAHITEQRMRLPVYGEEQQIMEAISAHPVVVLSGETGSGKTTQVPQFLFEAGYGDPQSPNPGIIGITQPRRVAAVSMAHRVSAELGDHGHTVAHQVRFDTTASSSTRVKFMTEGVLLRELAHDLLLTRYSVVIIDEAHERSLNTDILLGVLSRVVRLRQKRHEEDPQKTRMLRLVIMSATLRVDDFVQNKRLFSTPPPVINVEARQYPVRVHFNRRTPAPGKHVAEAVRKVAKIHKRLPEGGILVFLSGQAEITHACKKLAEMFPASGPQSSSGPRRAANALEEDVEAEDIDLGADADDFDDDFDDSDDSEEESEVILGSDNPADRTQLLNESLHAAPESSAAPLHVLPLYSLLPADQQLRVFSAPPAGHRLCVVATNVAETSITIPGIRYVVDAGLAKEKTYDAQTQVQRFDVQWTSKASANQRTGRAGRTGPGHSYRLYSSAVFGDQFREFSEPEILRMPIEGVVLQMKAMRLDSVANFPFPTPPDHKALVKAERLLAWLGAIDSRGHVTELGRLMAVFPVAPRFAKMLIVGAQHGCLAYVVAAVAALSVGDPFERDAERGSDSDSDDESVARLEAANLTSAELAAKERRRLARKRYWRVQTQLAGSSPTSDVLKWLSAVGAYEYAGGGPRACADLCVRTKAMNEIRRLRGQLTRLVKMYCPGVELAMDPKMAPPSKLQQDVVRQVLLAGFLDHVAVRGDIAGYDGEDDSKGARATPYITMWSDEPVFVHPESVVHIAARRANGMPQAIVFTELTRTTRLWARVVSAVSPKWLALIGKELCTFGNPLPYPLPKYNDAHDRMTCYVEPRFGPKSWLLPMVKVEESRNGTRWTIDKVLG